MVPVTQLQCWARLEAPRTLPEDCHDLPSIAGMRETRGAVGSPCGFERAPRRIPGPCGLPRLHPHSEWIVRVYYRVLMGMTLTVAAIVRARHPRACLVDI